MRFAGETINHCLIAALDAKHTAPPPQPVAPERGEAKAVAWRQHTPLDNWRFSTINRSADAGWEPLYATPQPPPAPRFRDPTIEDAIRARDKLFCEAVVATIDSSGPRLVNDTEKMMHHFNTHRPDKTPALNAIGAKVGEK